MTSNASPDNLVFDSVPQIGRELGLPERGVRAVVKLLADGATVPFVARYRKEATGGLDEVQIRNIQERHEYLGELEARRASVIAEIDKQGKLTPELRTKLAAAATKTELEDLYLPFKPKRRTRATMARERGLEPLAELMWTCAPGATPGEAALGFVDTEKGVATAAAALAGARDICAERMSEDAEVRRRTRDIYLQSASIKVEKTKEHEQAATKFDTYDRFCEPISKLPSHRYLAIRRGEQEGVLRSTFELETDSVVGVLEKHLRVDRNSPWANELLAAIADAMKRLLLPSIEVDVRVELKLRSDQTAIDVFAQNLRELLLFAPLGPKAVLGIDPGQRTGCKCAVVDETGRLVDHATIYLVGGSHKLEEAARTLRELCRKHPVCAVAVGNGTHGRETETFVRQLLAAEGLTQVFCVCVNEAGASVYSASDVAREEFPDLDLTVRGAISIARRLQDPLAELVKIDPKSIGVGQYQHDVYQPSLARKLDEVVESCVNCVGVEANTASAQLLARVAGVGPALAKRIVAHRDQRGPFASRRDLLDVSGLGPRTFEQAAGFLRIRDGQNPLDASAVHPERYALIERMAADLGVPVTALIGNRELIGRIDRQRYEQGDVGAFTLTDILAELEKPGRDPRASFEPPQFRDDVRQLEDVKAGMELEGVVTNVTAFGAFVDVGVHQDGLVHVSELADRFVRDASEVVKVGDRLKVRVLAVDLDRRRISLSARTRPREPGRPNHADGKTPGGRQPPRGGTSETQFRNNPFADLLKR
ncbi:MAG: RNA-binding transcriptional accessory protein [Polyangiaceae bacterium]|nr:RNA-binding transcriptional accessory protein [Polyangiaceae bacterium]